MPTEDLNILFILACAALAGFLLGLRVIALGRERKEKESSDEG